MSAITLGMKITCPIVIACNAEKNSLPPGIEGIQHHAANKMLHGNFNCTHIIYSLPA